MAPASPTTQYQTHRPMSRILFLLGALSCALAAYLIPVLLGYGWSALDPKTPKMVGTPVAFSRPVSGTISVEHFGTGVIEVGLSARINDFVGNGVLPLWNPRQGLGQPFAAMGEGNPLWPLRVARALVPYSSEIFVTLIASVLSGLAMFGLLRVMDVSFTSATLGAALWLTNGSLALHLARPNIFDQVAMLPALFFGIALLMRTGTTWSFAIASLLTGAFAIAGFPQIAAVGLIAAVAFALINAYRLTDAPEKRKRLMALAGAAIVLGGGLAAFYLLPLAENVVTGWEPRTFWHGFLPMPYSNLVSFFFPVVAGQPMQNWMPGGYPDVTDWNNLYGHSSTLCLYLLCVGAASVRTFPPATRVAFIFFAAAGAALYFKYVSLLPFSLFNFLPLVGTITPKHVNGLTAFLFVVAAALVFDHLRAADLKRANRFFVILCGIGVAILAIGMASVHDPQTQYLPKLALVSITLTLVIVGAAIFAVSEAAKSSSIAAPSAWALLLVVIVAEGLTYTLLGNNKPSFIWERTALALLVLFTGWAAAHNRRRLATGGVLVSLLGYGALITLPKSGLPERANLREPAAYMKFLKSRDVDQYRTFGINADYSGVGAINDLSVAGPFSPKSFRRFVETVADPDTDTFHRSSAKFYLERGDISIGSFPLAQYFAMKPIFDWLGLKYLILEKKYFVDARRTDHHELLERLPTVYDDTFVTIVESAAARPKAEFFPSIDVANKKDELKRVQNDPAIVERAALVRDDAGIAPQEMGAPVAVPLTLDSPNELQATFNAPSRGVLVMKQALSPGWQASVDGTATPIIPVAGMVQGILIPQAGTYAVTLRYRPLGFTVGLAVSALALLCLIAILVAGAVRQRWRTITVPSLGRDAHESAPDA